MSDFTPPEERPSQGYESPVRPEPQPQSAPLQPAAENPIVTYALLGITGLIFAAQLASAQLFGFDLPQALGLKVNELIAEGQVWRLFTPMVLHGSIPHFLFNMYALYIFGRVLERYYGHMRYLALYVVAGFAGNVFSMIFTEAPSLGSSTAIFGLLGAQGVFLYQNRGLLGKQGSQALRNVIIIALANLVIGLSPQIDNWGHLGGLFGGVLFAWFAGPVMKVDHYAIPPTVIDTRQAHQFITTTAWVAAIFALLALITIAFRIGLV